MILLESSSRMAILQTLSATLLLHPHQRGEGTLAVIPYVAGMNEDISHVCRKLNIRVVLSPGQLSAQS